MSRLPSVIQQIRLSTLRCIPAETLSLHRVLLARNGGRRHPSVTPAGGNNNTRRFGAVISLAPAIVGAVGGYVARQGSVGALGVNMGGGDLMTAKFTVHKDKKKDRKDSKSKSKSH